jgi:hypothetical protein
MEIVKINSRIQHFKIVSKILESYPGGIDAEAVFHTDPLYTGLEAMAQTAALHVRHSLRFERHAFLLSVHHCQMPPIGALTGVFRVTAGLRNRSSEAFLYHAVVSGPHGADFHSELLIGTRAYDDGFKKEVLAAHYQKMWARLREG